MSFSCVLLLELETRSYLFVSQNMLRAAAVFFFVSTAAAWIAPSGMLVRHHSCRPSALNWGPYGEKAPSEEEPTSEVDDTYKKPAGITAQSLFELIALGAGAPNLGKFKGVDKDTGALQFELEKNNFKSKKTGKVYNSFDNRDGSYFEAGYVDEDADFMGKLFGFGKKK